jgi:hypothetical protein
VSIFYVGRAILDNNGVQSGMFQLVLRPCDDLVVATLLCGPWTSQAPTFWTFEGVCEDRVLRLRHVASSDAKSVTNVSSASEITLIADSNIAETTSRKITITGHGPDGGMFALLVYEVFVSSF